MNSIVFAVCLMLLLSLMRVNVVIALTLSAVIAGLISGMGLDATVNAFNAGLGNGAEVALSYALLGAFAAALSHSGLTSLLSKNILTRLNQQHTQKNTNKVRWALLSFIVLAAVSSGNIIPIHIAFIPILIPPLLHVMEKLSLDRRLVACVLTFGLVINYITVPIGFGGIYLNEILLKSLTVNGLNANASQVLPAMVIPAAGMILGLVIAVFISYRKPRQYNQAVTLSVEPEQPIHSRNIIIALVAISSALIVQLLSQSMIFGALIGFIIFSFSGALRNNKNQNIFDTGVKMMANIGFIMIAAAGFASVLKSTGEITSLVNSLGGIIGDSKGLAAFFMLLVGLIITMGIGSSFSTVPIIAAIYVPLALSFGFSTPAIIALVGTAGALGDAGSPASDSTLGPTSGLNIDGQHDHMRDSVIPTFIHYNLPLLVFGWIAVMSL
ncbi:Na+/H+ antiporter NhaC family protein [uncultured Shewanella sp.]|uniref:Na+/H+ antiporter family protein n=1 Tax=uncultured Shewanella sp. TaxID=173975 RepID=UPI0026194F5D|nr:Na+/H+ antiporter NhaC family protein [uncultured Shewanella sp.]